MSVRLRKQKSGKDVISIQEVWNYGMFGKLPLRSSASYNTHRDDVQEDTQKLLQNPTPAVLGAPGFPATPQCFSLAENPPRTLIPREDEESRSQASSPCNTEKTQVE